MADLFNFGDVFPPRNLGSGEQWGRKVELRVEGLERRVTETGRRVENEGRILNSRADLQADQILQLSNQQDLLREQQLILEDQQDLLESQQRELGAQQDLLQNQQTTLQSQQALLQSQQAELQSLVNAIPITQAHSGNLSGFSILSGTRSHIILSIPVPSGKTRASVFAVGQALFFSDNVPQASIAAWRVQIAGNNGPYGTNVFLNMDGKGVTFSHSRQVVNPGSTLDIRAQTVAGQNHPTYPENFASLHATVTFSN